MPHWEMVDEAMAEILRQKTPAQRLAITDGLWRMARDLIHGTLKSDHPEWSHEELQRATARRMSHGAI
jgi:Rv0078B-related antitoxin